MKLVEPLETDDRSDIQKDMDALSQIRDDLLSDFKKAKSDKIDLANTITHVINARQNSELLQLKIWGLLEGHEHDDENCPDCGEPMETLPKTPDSN